MHLKMSSAKWRLFGLGLNELMVALPSRFHIMMDTFQRGIKLTTRIRWHLEHMLQLCYELHHNFGNYFLLYFT